MEQNNIVVDEVVLNELIKQLFDEGKKEEAMQVINVDFEKYQLKRNRYTEKLFRNAERAEYLEKKSTESNPQKQVTKKQGRIVDNKLYTFGGKLHPNQFKGLNSFKNKKRSESLEQLNDKNQKTRRDNKLYENEKKLHPNQLKGLNSFKDKKRSELTEVRRLEKIEVDKLTSAKQTNEMKKLSIENGSAASMRYLNAIVSSGAASTVNCNYGLNHLCDTSKECRDLIHKMETEKIGINETILNSLMKRLILENKKEEAQIVIEVDFPKHGLEANEKTLKIIAFLKN